MVKYPNYIREYYGRIKTGNIITSKRVEQQYKMLYDKLNNPVEPYVYDDVLANKPIEFIERFVKQSQGTNMGKPLKLQLFQKAKLQAMFGFIHENSRLRQYREVMTIEGRKNGKTTENSAISLYMLIGDGEGSAECYFVATKKDQANIGFDEALKMVKQSKDLSKHVRKRQSDIYFEPTSSKIQALASDANSLDGLNSHFVTIDELAAIKDRDLYDVMKQSTSSREQAMISTISTNGFHREGVYDNQYDYACRVLDGDVVDDRFLAFLYELDSRDEWTDEDMWIKANPGLGTIKKVDELRSFVEKAKVDTSSRPTVLTKDFNMTENSSTSWLDMSEIENLATFDIGNKDMGFKYGIGGLDISSTTDLTAATIMMRRPNDKTLYVEQMFWLPSNSINDRSSEDNVPYDLYERQGILRPSGEHTIDLRDVIDWFNEIRQEYGVIISWIGYDDWGLKQDSEMLREFKGNFGQRSMVIVRQGAQTLSGPMKEIQALLGAKEINYNNNNLMKLCLINTEAKVDMNGNIRPDKSRDNRKRIDGTIALLCSYTVYNDKKGQYLDMVR